MSAADHRFASRQPALFLLQVMDRRKVWRTRRWLGSVVAALQAVAVAPAAYAGGRLRLVEVGRERVTGASLHREVMRTGGEAPVARRAETDARALVSTLRGCGEWAGRHPRREGGRRRGRRARRAVAAMAVLLALGATLPGDAPWSAPTEGPGAAASLAAAVGSVLDAVGPPIELIGAALARELAPEPAVHPAPHLTFGVSWRETLDAATGRGLACRGATSTVVACELGRRVWLHDARRAQLLFDRRDGRLAAILVVSRLLVDREQGRDGRAIAARFAEIKGAIDRLLPAGYTVTVRTEARTGVPFWSGLAAADGGGGGVYAARWAPDAATLGPAVWLRLYGLDADRGFYRLLVERPR